MTSVTIMPASGPAGQPESALRVKSAPGGADRVFGHSLRGSGLLVLLIMTTIGSQFVFAPTAFAQGFVPISGTGSTGSFTAIDQWRRNVGNRDGIKVNFSLTGSSDGRNQFKYGTVDFAVSEIEYAVNDGGVVDPPPTLRTFGYMPIVPVVQSDGSGTTAQSTRWMAAKHGVIWDAYCGRPNCGFTSSFPVKPGVEAKRGSQGMAGFVADNTPEGELAYDFLGEGQQQAEALGYAPLPVNLAQAGVDQVALIPGSTNKLSHNDLKVNNPTFSPDGTDLQAKNTPQPPQCDRKGGSAQCTIGTGGAQTPMPPRGPPTSLPDGTSCLTAIRMLLEGLPRAVGETTRNGNVQWVWRRARLANELVATTARLVAETAGSNPVQVIDR